jgi:hypothetical protein
MGDSAIQRLLWKEYRVQRGFWLSMAGLAVICQLIVLLVPEHVITHAGWLFGLAMGIPAFYALGCGATLFAAEREEGTLEQLRVLAAPSWKVWWSKVGFSVASTAGLLALLLVLAFNFAHGNIPDGGTRPNFWAFWGMMTAEFLAWGIFFSLLTKRPLNAACMAAVASLASSAIISLVALSDQSGVARGDNYMPAVLCCILHVLCLFALDEWIALRWVLDRPARRSFEQAETEEQTEIRLFAHRVVLASAAAFAAIVLVPTVAGSSTLVANQVSQRLTPSLPIVWGVALVESIAWGTFFSVRVRKAIVAAFLAASVGFIFSQILTILTFTIFAARPLRAFAPTFGPIPLRMFGAMIVLVIDIGMVLRWRTALSGAARGETERLPARSGSLMRVLAWQEGRQAWRTITVFWGAAIALLAFYGQFDPMRDNVSFVTAVGVAVVFASLMGSCAFLAEQEGQHFRFFANRGVNPGRVWFAKQFVWLPVALVTAGAFCWISYNSLRHVPPFGSAEDLLNVSLLLATAYCCGQFASMVLTRGLVAGLVGLVFTMIVCSWQLLMLRLNVALWWSVLPIPLVLLLATWLHAPNWMLERRDWRVWLRLVVVLLIPIIGLPAAVAAHRVFEIPGTGPGFSPEQLLRPVTTEEAETAAMYRRAIALLVPMRSDGGVQSTNDENELARQGWDHATATERAWLESNRESLEITIQATKRRSCVFYDPLERSIDNAMNDVQAARELAWLLVLEARRLESDGELVAALDGYLATIRLGYHVASQGTLIQFMAGDSIEALACDRMPRWAAHPDQKPDHIRHAISRLDELFRYAPPLSDAIRIDYLMLRHALQTHFDEVASEGETDGGRAIIMRRLMPWEYARAFRLLDYRTSETLRRVADVDAALSNGRPPGTWKPKVEAGYDEQTRIDKWAHTTLLPQAYRADSYLGDLTITAEARRRALRVILALKAWQHVHGDLPKTLDVLVGDYFERLPLDPQSATPFGYAPRGFETPVRSGPAAKPISAPGQPMLWNQGPIRSIGTADDGYPRFEALEGAVNVYPIP